MSVQIEDGPLLPGARDVRIFDERTDWEAGRHAGFGASDIAAILKINPDRSEWDVYAKRMLGPAHVPRALRKIYRRGHREEPRILEDYNEATGDEYIHLQNLIVDGPYPVSVSPDAFIRCHDMGNAWGNAETKTDRSGARWGRSGTLIERWTPEARKIVREDYAAQAYAQMLGTGLPYTRLIVRRDMDDLRWYTLMADKDIQSRMHERVAEWWERHILQGVPPDPDGSKACLQAQAKIYGAGNERQKQKRPATPEEIALAMAAYQASEAEKAAEKQKNEFRSQLAKSIGDDYGVEWVGPDGRVSSVIYIDKQGRWTVDTDKLKFEHKEVYDAVAVQGPPQREIHLYIKGK